MGGTKCLRLGTCELEDMGGVLQKNSSIYCSGISHSPLKYAGPSHVHVLY